MTEPYTGLTVVEFGAGAAIAYAGKLFADMGATVVKIEPPGGDAVRRHTAFDESTGTTGQSGWGVYLLAGKQSVVVDVAQESGRTTLRDVIRSSSVVLHSDRDPGLAKYKLTPEALAAEFPKLIVASVTPFGLREGWRTAPADDLSLQALGGISLGIGEPGRAPLKLPGDQSAYQAGLAAAVAVSAQLFSDKGALIDVAAADVWASFYNGGEIANDSFGRKRRPRAGYQVSRQPYVKAIFPCKDGFFSVQCLESRQWQAFLKMIGGEDLLSDPLFANRAKAGEREADACNARLEPWFRERTKDEILTLCLEHRIPGAPVYDIREVVGHPHLEHRRYFSDVATEQGAVRVPTHPFLGLGADTKRARRMPALDEHRHEPRAGVAEQRRPFRGGTADRPLAGLRVVDFGWVWAGAIPGHILADLGAEVIKVESRSPLDFMRQGRPLFGTAKDPEQNPVFQNVNRGKLSLCINLQKPGAADVMKDLIRTCDVVIDNFAPGVMEKFGLGWKQLVEVRPDLVMCSMSAAGQDGPLRGIRTYAVMIGALSGLNSVVGYVGERVIAVQSPPYADPNAGIHAAFGILAALSRRERTADGAYIDLSQWEAAVNMMGAPVMDYVLNQRVPGTCGTRQQPYAPYGHYPVAGEDKWVSIAIEDDPSWDSLAIALGRPSWMGDPEFSTAAQRLTNRARLDALLAGETAGADGERLSADLRERGIPSFSLLDIGEIAKHPYFESRELFESVAHPILKSVPVYRLPWHLNGRPISITRRAPYLGEHTEQVLKDLLGRSSTDIDLLRAGGVLE